MLSLIHAQTIEEAIALVNARSYGNMACIFTTDGANARRFRYEVQAGNVGINVGVAAPMFTFPFSGWGDSFFGDLHAQAHHAVEFSPRRRWWWSGGRRSGTGSSKNRE